MGTKVYPCLKQAPKPGEYPPLIAVREALYRLCIAEKLRNDDCGVCDESTKLIMLSSNYDDAELLDTFWHELLHAFEAEYNTVLGHKLINKLAEFLAQVSRQLP